MPLARQPSPAPPRAGGALTVTFVDPDARLLQDMLRERAETMRQLAPILRRVGAHHPERQHVNARRAKRRKALRRYLRLVDSAISALVASTLDRPLPT